MAEILHALRIGWPLFVCLFLAFASILTAFDEDDPQNPTVSGLANLLMSLGLYICHILAMFPFEPLDL